VLKGLLQMKAGGQIAMKPIISKRLVLFTLAAVLGCSPVAAQIFSSLHDFTPTTFGLYGVNDDGA